MASYRIDGKKIYATVAKLKATELKEIKNYVALGYEIIDVKPQPLTKEEKAAKQDANHYSQKNVLAFLQQKGNEELLKEYNKRYNEQAGTNRTKDGVKIPDEPKFLKNGQPKKKGYANCIGWFRSLYTWNEDSKAYIKAN